MTIEWYDKAKRFFSSARGRDILLYLLFVAISAIFWSVLTLGNSIQTHCKVKFTIDGIPAGTTLITDCPEYLDVSVKNNGYAFVRYMVGAMPEITVNFNRYSDGKGRMVLTKQNIDELLRSVFGKDASIDTFSPEQMVLRYTTHPGKKVPVKVDGDFTADLQYVVNGSVVAMPGYVTVFSDAENLDAIDAVSTMRVVRHNLKGQTEVKVALRSDENVRVVPDSVVIRIPVEPLVSKEQDVAISVVNCPETEHLVAFPATLRVSYLLPLSAYNRNAAQLPVVFVDYNDIRNGLRKLPLHVKKSELLRGVSLPVDSVEYIIE